MAALADFIERRSLDAAHSAPEKRPQNDFRAEILPERYRSWPRPLAYAAIGLSRTLRTTKRVARFRHLLLFLIAFMLYNDGIQTVIEMATAYGTEELRLEAPQLMLTLLIIQAIAVFGALLFGRIAGQTMATR